MQFGDARMVSAQGALCVMLKVEGVPLHGERIEGQQRIGQRIAYAGNTLDGLCSLHSAQHPRNGSEHPNHGACLHILFLGRLGEQTSVTCRPRQMSHHLSCISVYATDAERFAEHHTGIIHEILGGEIVCPINDKIIVADDVQCIVLAQEKRYLCGLHIRVQGLYLLCSRPHLLCTHIRGIMYHLPLQIVERNDVTVEQTEMSHACRSEILCNWRTQSA